MSQQLDRLVEFERYQAAERSSHLPVRARTVLSFPSQGWAHGKQLSAQYKPEYSFCLYVILPMEDVPLPLVVLAEVDDRMDAVEIKAEDLLVVTLPPKPDGPILELNFRSGSSNHFTFPMAHIRVLLNTGSHDFDVDEMVLAQGWLRAHARSAKKANAAQVSNQAHFTRELLTSAGWRHIPSSRLTSASARISSSSSLPAPPTPMPTPDPAAELVLGRYLVPLRMVATQAGSEAFDVKQYAMDDEVTARLQQDVVRNLDGTISFSADIVLYPAAGGVGTFSHFFSTAKGSKMTVHVPRSGDDTFLLSFDLGPTGDFHLHCVIDTSADPFFPNQLPLMLSRWLHSSAATVGVVLLSTIAHLERVQRAASPPSDLSLAIGIGPHLQGLHADLFSCVTDNTTLCTSSRGRRAGFRLWQTNSSFIICTATPQAPSIVLRFSEVRQILLPEKEMENMQLFSIELQPASQLSELAVSSLCQHFHFDVLAENLVLHFGTREPKNTVQLAAFVQRFPGRIDWAQPIKMQTVYVGEMAKSEPADSLRTSTGRGKRPREPDGAAHRPATRQRA
ncbi:hypothetical protein RQP46_005135 [Phenoliferia psychrophenolica]